MNTSEQHLVSVIMPVFNGEKTIIFAINSLLLQSYSNWKCIIVNDGSTDKTAKILEKYECNSRFKIIHLPENLGRGAARQIALENAEGDFIAFLDADDFYPIDKLRKQVDILLIDGSISLVAGRTITFDENWEPYGKRGLFPLTPILYKKGDPIRISMATAMIRLPEAKCYSYNSKLNASEDRDYFAKYLDGKKYKNIPVVLLYYFVPNTIQYTKILSYTQNEIYRSLLLFKDLPPKAIRLVLKSSMKWIVYATMIPILGTKFFLRRRGAPLSAEESKLFFKLKVKLSDIY